MFVSQTCNPFQAFNFAIIIYLERSFVREFRATVVYLLVLYHHVLLAAAALDTLDCGEPLVMRRNTRLCNSMAVSFSKQKQT